MDTPRQGFRRAAVASWALVGVGIAGVGGASALAYADTGKPAQTTTLTDATVAVPEYVDPAPQVLTPPPIEPPPSAPELTTTTEGPPPQASPAPAPPAVPEITPDYTPRYTPDYTPAPTVEQAPDPVPQKAPAPRPTRLPTTKQRSTPTTVMAPNYSPHITVSRGS